MGGDSNVTKINASTSYFGLASTWLLPYWEDRVMLGYRSYKRLVLYLPFTFISNLTV